MSSLHVIAATESAKDLLFRKVLSELKYAGHIDDTYLRPCHIDAPSNIDLRVTFTSAESQEKWPTTVKYDATFTGKPLDDMFYQVIEFLKVESWPTKEERV